MNPTITQLRQSTKELRQRIGQAFNGLRSTPRQQKTRFNADAWLQVWMTQDELATDEAIIALQKNTAMPEEEKIKVAKQRALELAQQSLADAEKAASKWGVSW